MEGAEDAVEKYPDERHQHRGVVLMHLDAGLPRFDIVPGKLLLAAGALQAGGEEAEDHLRGEYGPDEDQDHGTPLHGGEHVLPAPEAAAEIEDEQAEKEQAAINQADIMQDAHRGEAHLAVRMIHGSSSFLSFRWIMG